MFYEEGSTFNMFVRVQAYAQCVVVRNPEYKQKLCLSTRKLQQGNILSTADLGRSVNLCKSTATKREEVLRDRKH